MAIALKTLRIEQHGKAPICPHGRVQLCGNACGFIAVLYWYNGGRGTCYLFLYKNIFTWGFPDNILVLRARENNLHSRTVYTVIYFHWDSGEKSKTLQSYNWICTVFVCVCVLVMNEIRLVYETRNVDFIHINWNNMKWNTQAGKQKETTYPIQSRWRCCCQRWLWRAWCRKKTSIALSVPRKSHTDEEAAILSTHVSNC